MTPHNISTFTQFQPSKHHMLQANVMVSIYLQWNILCSVVLRSDFFGTRSVPFHPAMNWNLFRSVPWTFELELVPFQFRSTFLQTKFVPNSSSKYWLVPFHFSPLYSILIYIGSTQCISTNPMSVIHSFQSFADHFW